MECHFADGCQLGNFSTELSAQSEQIRTEFTLAMADWGTMLALLIAQAQQDGSLAADGLPEEIGQTTVDMWHGCGAPLESRTNPQPAG